MQPRGDVKRLGDALDQIPQAHPFKGGVVRLVGRLLSDVACKGAYVAHVLHPRQPRLPLIGFLRHQQSSAVRDALDVRSDSKRVIGGAKDGGRPDHGPRKVSRSRDDGLAPSFSVHVLEARRRLPLERNEIFLARRLAVQVRVDACRNEHVAVTLEVANDGLNLDRLIAREVEQHVRFDLIQRPFELLLVGAVECDVAGENAVRPFLAARGNRLNPTSHQLLASGAPNEPRAAKD